MSVGVIDPGLSDRRSWPAPPESHSAYRPIWPAGNRAVVGTQWPDIGFGNPAGASYTTRGYGVPERQLVLMVMAPGAGNAQNTMVVAEAFDLRLPTVVSGSARAAMSTTGDRWHLQWEYEYAGTRYTLGMTCTRQAAAPFWQITDSATGAVLGTVAESQNAGILPFELLVHVDAGVTGRLYTDGFVADLSPTLGALSTNWRGPGVLTTVAGAQLAAAPATTVYFWVPDLAIRRA